MKKIMFNDRFGLTQAVFDGRKTMRRRVCTMTLHRKGENGTLEDIQPDDMFIDSNGVAMFRVGNNCYKVPTRNQPQYKVGEEVAVAQKYIDLKDYNAFYEALTKADPTFPLECIEGEKGCNNKMYVKAAWMPHRIRITEIRAERLQDISDEDCLREGVQQFDTPEGKVYVAGGVYVGVKISKGMVKVAKPFKTPREAFAVLINKISGKGTWERNPWVFAYEFELET